MSSTVFLGLTVAILITTLTVFKSRVLEYISTDSIHAFLIFITDSGSIIASNRVEKVDIATSLGTCVTRTSIVEVFFSLLVKSTNILNNFSRFAFHFEISITFLLLCFKGEWRADRLFSFVLSGNTFSVDTSESTGTFNCITCRIMLFASSMKTEEALVTFYIHAFSDLGRNVALGFMFKGSDMVSLSLNTLLRLGEDGSSYE